MITDRMQLTLVPGIKPCDLWNVFCTWRINAKYTPKELKNWCDLNKDLLKNYEITYSGQNETYKKITSIFNESEQLFGIQLYEYEGFATFISTIITDFSVETPKLSFTVEKKSENEDPDKHTKYKRPLFFNFVKYFTLEDKTFDEDFMNEKLTWYYVENHQPSQLQVVKEQIS